MRVANAAKWGVYALPQETFLEAKRCLAGYGDVVLFQDNREPIYPVLTPDKLPTRNLPEGFFVWVMEAASRVCRTLDNTANFKPRLTCIDDISRRQCFFTRNLQ